ncbi:hypothetical protein THAPSDRAFT_263745 [Thalassiosira pseudonana CCMP1335]
MLNIAFLSVFSCNSFRKSSSTTHRPTYGIKSSPLTQIAFLFSALVHDVDHTGISNRQLVLESDDLAILYNDQSVAEQRSLAVAFSTLKGVGYRELRGGGEEDQFKFRKLVIDLVLVTDIASPERTQIVKSKWKEAFGEVQFAEKLKKRITVMEEMMRRRVRLLSPRSRFSTHRVKAVATTSTTAPMQKINEQPPTNQHPKDTVSCQ